MTHTYFSLIFMLLFGAGLLLPTAVRAQPQSAVPINTGIAQPTDDLDSQRIAVHEARAALARRLAAAAQEAVAQGQHDRALLLAREAVLTTWQVDGEINTAPAILPEAELALAAAVNLAKAAGGDEPRLIRRFKTSEPWVWEARFSTDGRTLATASDDDTASLWDVRTGRETLRVQAPGDQIFGVALSPDGQTLVTVANRGMIRLWNTATGQEIGQLVGHQTYVESALFSPDGHWLATADGDDHVLLWEMSSGALRHRVTGDFNLLAFSHASTWLATVDAPTHTIQLWDLQTGVRFRSLVGHKERVAFLRIWDNDLSLESVDETGAARLVWNVDQSDPVQAYTLPVDQPGVQTLAGAGAIIASTPTGSDRVTLQNLATGARLAQVDSGHGVGHVEAFSPNGREFVTTGSDGTLAIWLTNPADHAIDTLLDLAEGLITRQPAAFTPTERQEFSLDKEIGRFWVAPSAVQAAQAQRFVRAVVVAPTKPETRFALTNDGRLWRAVADQDAWELVHVVDPDLTPLTLGIDAALPHTLYLGTAQGLYRADDTVASFALVNTLPAAAISVVPGHANELWAGDTTLWHSEDGGNGWREASQDMSLDQRLGSPLVIVPPNNNPFFIIGLGEEGAKFLWRSNGNGFWKFAPTPDSWDQTPVEQIGLAWDNGNHTLFAGDVGGRLYQSRHALAPDERKLTWSVAADFGADSQVIPLAVGEGPSIYLTVKRPTGNLFLQGVKQGEAWQWQPLRLAETRPLVAPSDTPAAPDQKMIVNTGYQLWLADAASDKLAQVATETDEILQVQLSPAGSHVAYVVDSAPDERFRGLALRLLTLADQTVQTISPLQATTPLGRLSEGDHAAAEHATRAILDEGRGGIAWSPSGKQLAFVSSHEQPTAQLYVYDLAQATITPLPNDQATHEPSHAYQLVWSPDEQWLFHTGATSFNYTEPRQTPVGVWVSRPDGSEEQELYPVAAGSSDERLVAWVDNHTLLLHSATTRCGNRHLRTLDLTTGQTTMITRHAFSSVSYDAESGAALIGVAPGLRCNSADRAGLYRWQQTESGLRQITTQDLPWPSQRPWQPGWQLVGETRIDWVQPDGTLSQGDPTPAYCLLDFGRDAFAWTVTRVAPETTGTWVRPYGEPAQRLADSARLLQWSGDGAVLYFVAGNGTDLYVAAGPDYQPHLLGQTPPVRTLHRTGRAPALAGCG